MISAISVKPKCKSTIIEILAKEHSLSAKDIFNKLDANVTYQYVHKLLKKMVAENYLVLDKTKYSLNKTWIKKLDSVHQHIHGVYKHENKVFARFSSISLLNLFSKSDLKKLTDEVQKLVNDSTIMKLNEWYCKYYDPENKEIKALKKLTNFKNKKVLEVGCGTGRITKYLLKETKSLTAIDINKECIEYCKKKYPKANFLHGDITNVGEVLNKEKFDLIVCSWIGIHYFNKNMVPTIISLKKHLKKGGKLIIIESYHNTDYVNILDCLSGSKNQIKQKTAKLEECLVDRFDTVSKEVVKTIYKFPDKERLFENFKIEFGFENDVKWTKTLEKKLDSFLKANKLGLNITASPIFLICQ